MNINDPIADFLTRLRNAAAAGHERVEMPYSRMRSEIARILKKEGYIRDYVKQGEDKKPSLMIYLKYDVDQAPIIQGLKRVSRPGLRQYVKVDSIPRVLGGLGIAILSTSSGVMTDREAREKKIGGEVLCNIW